MKPTARRRLGKYVLLGRLGHGGMGKIYLAYAPGPAGIEKLLVVKRLHGHLTGDPVLVDSFLDEARLSMALNHPNIVHTYDVGEVEGRYFMVMEYIEGQNLGVVLRTAKRSGAYPASAVWGTLFVPVLDALHSAHTARDARGRQLEIIHRDVSPQNVLVTYEGRPKLVDFGIAKAAMRVNETDAGVLKGKYAYMSPEQVRGEPLDARSDVFAAGIVLWEMLAGRRLYKADTIVRSVERILTEPVISPVRVNSECDPEIAKVAFKALQKDREQRFATALDFKDALDDALRRGEHQARQADVRALMQRLFADVIARQRAVLEMCLNAADAPAAGDADDDDEPRRPSDSESDVSMKALHQQERSEVTTPSSVRVSPLVTAEGERQLDDTGRKNAATSLDRKRRATPSDPADANSAEATATSGDAAAFRRSRAPLAAALALLVLALVVGVVVAGWRATHPGEVAIAPAPAVPREAPALPVAPPPPTTAPTPTPTTTPTPTPPPTPGVAVTPPTPQPEPSVEPRRRAARRKPAAEEPRKGERREERPSVAEKSEEKTAEKSAADGGMLSLDTVPWTTVYLGKKKLGETPLVRVPVPSGALELSLVNNDQNIHQQYIANVKPGAEFRARLDLH